MRATPMRRGALSKTKAKRRTEIAATFEAHGLPTALAARVSFQLVCKFSSQDLGEYPVWREAARMLRYEFARLLHHVGLREPQIILVLPKLSARSVEDFLEELQGTDRRIARTILNAAIEAADPVTTGRRYVTEYQHIAQQLAAIDPSVARTIANACFTAAAPRRIAMEHFKHFAALLRQFEHNVSFARMLAKASFRAADPVRTAEEIIASYHSIMDGMTRNGVDPMVARTFAGSSRIRAMVRTDTPALSVTTGPHHPNTEPTRTRGRRAV